MGGEDIALSFKPLKMALKMTHLMEDWKEFEKNYRAIYDTCFTIFSREHIEMSEQTIKEDLDNFRRLREKLIQINGVRDTVTHLNKEIANGKRILVEDSSSVSMDVDAGLYPFTDSYHTTTGAICTGLGVPEEAIETTIGVFSAVSIVRKEFLERIKDFPTHIHENEPEYAKIQDKLDKDYGVHSSKFEYGWTDLNLISYSELINKLSCVMLTHLDVLNETETIKLATKYSVEKPGGTVDYTHSLPANIDDWAKLEPKYTEIPGWN